MITKHTPGPWEVGNEAKGESPFMVYCNDATGQRIADCRNEFVFHSNEEKKANARLIALAPALYEYVASSASAGCATAQALLQGGERDGEDPEPADDQKRYITPDWVRNKHR